MNKKCEHCGKEFSPRPNVKKQHYCNETACQKARKRKWHQQKLKSDPDYRKNQAAAQEAWCKQHGDYWKKYREKHPEYTARNRLLQRERNRRRRVQ